MKNSAKAYFPQIDIIKALAIISVILTHTYIVTVGMLMKTSAQFHINQAVIVFFILIGITLTISFKQTNKKLHLLPLYTVKYFAKRINRLIIPFIIIFLISLFGGLLAKKTLYFGWLSLLGLLPVTGPGNYFFSIIIQFIFISPLIFYLYKKNPIMMLLGCYFLNFGFELLVPHFSIFDTLPYLYSASIFRYLFAMALGLFVSEEYLSSRHINLFSYKNYAILLMLPFSIFYLYLGHFYWQPFWFLRHDWGTHNIVAVPYVFVLTVILLNFNYQKWLNRYLTQAIAAIGKASYHIYLVQMLFLGFKLDSRFQVSPISLAIIDLTLTVTIGLFFYYLQNNVERLMIMKRKKHAHLVVS